MSKKIELIECPSCREKTERDKDVCQFCNFDIKTYLSKETCIQIFYKETKMQKIMKILSCEWITEWFIDTFLCKKRNVFLKILCFIVFAFVALAIYKGVEAMFLSFGLLSESLGIYKGISALVITILAPSFLIFIMHNKEWFWVITFVVGLIFLF